MAYLGPACGRHSFSLERSSVPTHDSSNPEMNESIRQRGFHEPMQEFELERQIKMR